MKFFFDRNIGVRLARMLDAYDAENTVRHLDDDVGFRHDTPDVQLIQTLAQEDPKPVFITADINMRKRNADERRALSESELTVVFVRKGFHSLDFHTQAVKLLRLWPEIVQETCRARRPTTFEVTAGAKKVQRVRATSEL